MPRGYIVEHPPVPLVSILVRAPEFDSLARIRVELLVDTGADATILHPDDSIRLFRTVAAWDWGMSHDAVIYGGAGHGVPHYRIAATLLLPHEDGTLATLSRPLYVAHPQPANRYHESLLRRDVLQDFTTTIEGTRSITLTPLA